MAKRKPKNSWIYLFVVILATILFYFLFPGTDTSITSVNDFVPTQTVISDTTNTPAVLGTTTWYEVYFTSPVIPFAGKIEGGIEDFLIEKINQADRSIDIAVYEFDLENVAQALIAAKRRGVEVRVVYDDELSDPDPQIRELKSAGIVTVPDNRSAFMHNKFFVFDDLCIWTGSFNISTNAAYRNNENALYFCSSDAAENYATEFEELFSGQFGSSSPANTPHPIFTVAGIKIENYFAPEDQIMEILVNRVGSAQKTIHFMAFSFTDDSLGQAMIDALKRGVLVAGIFETRAADTQYSECPSLLKQGADVTLDGNPRTFHHKVIIIDGRIVILGSFNFTVSADTENDENLLIIYDELLAADYEAEFLRMKAMSHETLDDVCQTKSR